MSELITASFQSLRSLFVPGMLGIFIYSLLITILVLAGFIAVVTYLTVAVPAWFGYEIASYFSVFGFFGSSIIAFILFPGIMPIIVNFFDEKIAGAIERKFYPHAKPVENPLMKELVHDAKFSLKAVLINIVLLPVYFFVPVVNIFIFYLVNGSLLGREFFVMVARRYMTIEKAEEMRRKYRTTILCGGVGLTIMATIPLLNLLAPFWGIAFMTHLFHFYRKMKVSDKMIDVTP